MKNILIPISFLLVIACNKKNQESVLAKPMPTNLDVYQVRTTTINSASGAQEILVNGVLISDLESKPAFKTGGVIEKTYFKVGDRINKGALLATLNMSEINAQVDQALKGVEKTSRDLARVKNLYADSVATLEQLQNATTAYEMSLETQKIALFNASYSKVIAPITGVVIKQIMGVGEIVGPGMPVCVIMGTGQANWVVKAAVSDKEWALVKKGDKANLRFEAYPNETLAATVTKMADISNVGTATLDIELKLDKAHPNLAAGLICTLSLTPKTKLKYQITIPIEALVSSNQGNAVVFVAQDGRAVKKNILIEKIMGNKVSVTNGLEGISEVITAGAVYLQEGDKIEIIK